MIYGAAALAYGDHVGALDTPWALAMLAWGVAVAIVAELERRRASRQVAAVGQR